MVKNGTVYISHTKTDLGEWLTGFLPLNQLELVPIWILKVGTCNISLIYRSSRTLVAHLLYHVESLLYLPRWTIMCKICLSHVLQPRVSSMTKSGRGQVYINSISAERCICSSIDIKKRLKNLLIWLLITSMTSDSGLVSYIRILFRFSKGSSHWFIKENKRRFCVHSKLIFRSGRTQSQCHTLSRHNLHANQQMLSVR